MRLWFSGPRIFGVRPGISIPLNPKPPQQRGPGKQIDGAFVYVVRGDHNMTKIGVTTNPRARLAQIKTGSAFPVDYAFIGATTGPGYDIEQEAHRLLGNRRVNGEWFDVSPEVAIAAVMSAAGKLGRPVQVVDLASSDRVLSIAAQGEPGEAGSEGMRLLVTFLIVLFVVVFGLARLEIVYLGADPWMAYGVNIFAGFLMLYLLTRLARIMR